MKPPAHRPAVTRERILRAALALIDHDGLDAISMRRVGEELGVEAMSLYHHVANKAKILDGIFEVVLSELPPAEPAGSWQEALRERARALRGVLRAHPGALPLFTTRPAVTPASLAHVEGVLEVLHQAGLSAPDALGAMQVLVAFVVGHTAMTCAPVRAEEIARPDYDALDASAFPRVRESARLLAGHDVEQEFELGLELILSGLGARAAPATAPGRRRSRSARRPRPASIARPRR